MTAVEVPPALGLPWHVLDDYRCFGCSPHNPYGLALKFTEHTEGIVTHFTLGRAHESYPGVVHGGLLGVICDETMGNLIVLRAGLVAFTVGMRMRYLEPVAIGRTYSCVATLGGSAAASDTIAAHASILDDTGSLVATSSATYRQVSFSSARDRIDLDDQQADRLDAALSVTAVSDPFRSEPGVSR